MGMFEYIRKMVEPKKCEICGEINTSWHERFCFETTFGYCLYEKIEPSTLIYFINMRKKYENN